MVVEDEPEIYDVLLMMFEIWGIEGVAFVDGPEAFSWIDDVDAGHVRGELPELAILDIRLPESSGPEVAARLRKSPVLGNIAILLITAYHLSPDEEEKAMQLAQADLLLYKPLPDMPELREKLDTIIAKRNAARPAKKTVTAPEKAPSTGTKRGKTRSGNTVSRLKPKPSGRKKSKPDSAPRSASE